MSEERVLSALRALAESDGEREASAEIEMRLRRAFRRRRLLRKTGWAAAAAVFVAVVWVTGKTGKNPGLHAKLPVPQPAIQAVLPVHEPGQEPGKEKVLRKRVRPREVVTEFYPLMDVAPPFEGGEILRVNLAAGAMRAVGLPVDEDRVMDRVQADVLVGQEGLARAIRFVKVVQ